VQKGRNKTILLAFEAKSSGGEAFTPLKKITES
jgi:hypothetical protein